MGVTIIEVAGRRYRIEVYRVGRNFGVSARITHRNGRPVRGFCGETWPLGHEHAALDEARRWLDERR